MVYSHAMTKKTFGVGDDVITPSTRGTVIDISPTPSGQFVFGVEDAAGEVRYFTPKALTHA